MLVSATRQPPASRFSNNRPVSARRGCTVNKPQGAWELYYLPEDFSQARDIGADHDPDKLAALKEQSVGWVLRACSASRSVTRDLLPGAGSPDSAINT